MGEGGVKNLEKLPTSLMDGPYATTIIDHTQCTAATKQPYEVTCGDQDTECSFVINISHCF